MSSETAAINSTATRTSIIISGLLCGFGSISLLVNKSSWTSANQVDSLGNRYFWGVCLRGSRQAPSPEVIARCIVRSLCPQIPPRMAEEEHLRCQLLRTSLVHSQLVTYGSAASGDGIRRKFQHASGTEVGPRHQERRNSLTQPNYPVSFVDQNK